ncbi:hypothetical protein [Streptomyces sp. NPDC002769]|uniref:hypothetical protein n=1 Tax=Streptomyces sp. NPDC002769 TaxID=3154542 RepID=UPI00332D01A8
MPEVHHPIGSGEAVIPDVLIFIALAYRTWDRRETLDEATRRAEDLPKTLR